MMGKIKLNLVSGAVVEKPLINAFKANNNSYVVFDNEMNGSMGLPIILVCKLEGNRLTKIVDQGEWQIVKEYLKNIIAGNQVEFIKVDSELAADDIYYTQLTLPVPSFDALKNAYKVEDSSEDTANILDINPEPVVNAIEQVAPMPTVEAEVPQVEPVVEPVVETPVVENPTPVVEPVIAPIDPVAPVIDIAVPEQPVVSSEEVVSNDAAIDLNTPMPTFGPQVQMETPQVEPVAPVMPEPEITPTPVIETEIPVTTEENIFKEQKEAFMLACENMFDALVQKFEKELENRK